MNIAVPILPSSNLTLSKQFYVEALGFRVIFESSEDSITGLIGLERDGPVLDVSHASVKQAGWSITVPPMGSM
jgi:catechol 2,3-dioxygenase-like lactoylglutathione lyase family enzyme